MGVYIKGMKMPKDCGCCPLLTGTFCDILNNDVDPFYEGAEKRDNNCPLVDLGRHGRLIDADALMNIFADRLVKVSERYGINSAVAGAVSGAMKLLDVQPTVIEAEGEG